MNKDKLARLKKQIKDHAPEIIAVTATVTGVAASVYLIHKMKPNDLLIAITPEDWDKVSSGDYIKVALENGANLFIAKEYHS